MADNNKKEKKNPTAGGAKVKKLVDEVAKLSVMELSELVTALQNKLGVSATMPVAATPSAGTPAEAGKQETGASAGGANQTVIITDTGSNKIAVIKALRVIDQNLTLMDAKKMTEELPSEVLKDAKAEDAKSAADKLKEAGATVELK